MSVAAFSQSTSTSFFSSVEHLRKLWTSFLSLAVSFSSALEPVPALPDADDAPEGFLAVVDEVVLPVFAVEEDLPVLDDESVLAVVFLPVLDVVVVLPDVDDVAFPVFAVEEDLPALEDVLVLAVDVAFPVVGVFPGFEEAALALSVTCDNSIPAAPSSNVLFSSIMILLFPIVLLPMDILPEQSIM